MPISEWLRFITREKPQKQTPQELLIRAIFTHEEMGSLMLLLSEFSKNGEKVELYEETYDKEKEWRVRYSLFFGETLKEVNGRELRCGKGVAISASALFHNGDLGGGPKVEIEITNSRGWVNIKTLPEIAIKLSLEPEGRLVPDFFPDGQTFSDWVSAKAYELPYPPVGKYKNRDIRDIRVEIRKIF